MNKLLTPFGLAVLKDRYLTNNETPDERFRAIATRYSYDEKHGDRIYSYISSLWFMPATPVINSNLPISCFLNQTEDNIDGITGIWEENSHLSAAGGGVGTCWSKVRSLYENTRNGTKSSGIIPFIHVMDSISIAINQGSLRRGAAAVYLDISHPEIEEFIDLRKQTGDQNRRSLNLHHGVTIPDTFMEAVIRNDTWNLIAPSSGKVIKTLSARYLWEKLLITRMTNQEPYIVWTDSANTNPIHKKLGLKITQSNLCSEIMLPTGLDHHKKQRTAVCCLSSVNLFYWDEWKDNKIFIKDCLMFLDNVLQEFIHKTQGLEKYKHANYSAEQERSVGLGVMGFHSYLQKNRIPFDSMGAACVNYDMFNHINSQTKQANVDLAREIGCCPDASQAGIEAALSNTTAIAPTANISIIAGGCSPGIEPWIANIFTHKTLSGSFEVKNRQLEKELEKLDLNTPEVWESILSKRGSVQHLDIPQNLKEVFKTAFEIDQFSIINLAGNRASMIDQGQSINLFLRTDISKAELNKLHITAWKRRIKSLYYVRSASKHKAEVIKTMECQACQ